ncbi:hypothetical protein [Echinicola salinicaeni]|uniref:hypothetical protein n=1 Tax=Echinicola salinicaeni TaxID=2762757 RepID=UPI0016445AC5|nr:hypothetical protein [Echinicola salinicaeni]
MKTFKRTPLLSLLIIALVNGCVVPSLYPLYTENELIIDERLEGVWVDNNEGDDDFGLKISKSNPRDSKDSSLSNSADKLYRLEHTDDGETVIFDLFLVKVGNSTYLDFFPNEYPDQEFKNLFGLMHIYPVHTFAKVVIKENELIIQNFDGDYIKKMIEQNRVKISHENISGEILLSASPNELQKFVLKYEDEPKLFEGKSILKRKG